MKCTYQISRLASIDLDRKWNYTAEQWSRQQANKYYRLIFKVIDKICSNPEIGKSIDKDKIRHRLMLIKSHLIVYKVIGNEIYIDRILHQRMDIDNQLNE